MLNVVLNNASTYLVSKRKNNHSKRRTPHIVLTRMKCGEPAVIPPTFVPPRGAESREILEWNAGSQRWYHLRSFPPAVPKAEESSNEMRWTSGDVRSPLWCRKQRHPRMKCGEPAVIPPTFVPPCGAESIGIIEWNAGNQRWYHLPFGINSDLLTGTLVKQNRKWSPLHPGSRSDEKTSKMNNWAHIKEIKTKMYGY